MERYCPSGNGIAPILKARNDEARLKTMDEVFLEGMRFYAFHGVNAEEKSQGQRFIVDVSVGTDLQFAGESDELGRTISYSAVYKSVKAIVEGPSRDLIEAVAEEIANTVLGAFSTARQVVVTVRKPQVPIKGAMLDAAGVRIVRVRAENAA